MLKIRREQMDLFDEQAELQFEKRALRFVQEYWPETFTDMGEEMVADSIRQGLAKARSYGIDQEYDILRFINHMYALGFDFDEDPRFPWAAEILENTEIEAQSRMDDLSKHTAALLRGDDPEGPVGE